MGSQAKVQGYLQRHKIGALFEDMMAKLVKDMPSEPLEYLASHIHSKMPVCSRLHALLSPVKSSGSPELKRGSDASRSTSVWASTDNRDYDKPWQAGTKRMKPKGSGTVNKSEWDATVKMSSQTFDDLMLAPAPAPAPAPGRKTVKPHKFVTSSGLATTDRHCRVTEEEFLAGELSLAKESKPEEVIKDGVSLRKMKGRKADAARHQKELQTYLNAQAMEKSSADSGIGADDSDDDAVVTELIENTDDLAAEGIKVNNGKGHHLKKASKRMSDSGGVSVTICARCANVMSGKKNSPSSVASSRTSVSSKTSKSTTVSKQPRSTGRNDVWETHRPGDKPKATTFKDGTKTDQLVRNPWPTTSRTVDTSDQNTSRRDIDTARTGFSSYYGDNEDEFESVSQVSGTKPKMPVWEESDDEQLITPRKGSSMLSSPRVNSNGKGKPQLSSTLREDVLRQIPTKTDVVEDFLGSNTWSGAKMDGKKENRVRQSHDPSRKLPTRGDNSRRSLDTLRGGKSTGWNLERNSDDESTVVP